MWPNPQETADLVTFTEEIFNGNLQFLCSENYGKVSKSNHEETLWRKNLHKIYIKVLK